MKIYIKAAVTDTNKEPLEDRQDIALDPNTPIDVLEQLSNDRDTSVLLCLICNPHLPDYLVDKILSDDRWTFLEQVASCLSTPPEILARLSEHKHPLVRCKVAWNWNTPADTLIKLSEDENAGIRWEVGGNKNTPLNILKKLSKDPNSTCRGQVAENPSTPKEILRELMQDSEEFVRMLAKRNYNGRFR